MMDLAQHAFQTENYDLAAAIYERNIMGHGPSKDSYLGLANSYAKSGDLQKAFEAYLQAARMGKLVSKDVEHLVDALLVKMNSDDKQHRTEFTFSCGKCYSLWFEPVTVSCGHTFCKRCIPKDDTCCVCSSVIIGPNDFVNILLCKTAKSCFPTQHQIAELKNIGNVHFEKSEYEGALDVYSKALELVPHSHAVLCDRSMTFAQLRQYDDALQDAQKCIELQPDWSKGYYLKAIALQGLSRHEEAACAFLKCLSFNPGPSGPTVREGLSQSLVKVLSPFQFDVMKEDVVNQTRDVHLLIRAIRDPGVWVHLEPHTDTASRAPAHTDPASRAPAHTEPASRSISQASCSDTVWNPDSQQADDDCLGSLTKDSSVSDECSSENECNRPVLSENNVLIQREDFECTLCTRLLYCPVSTPCGHTYCRECLHRSLDYRPSCPLCKADLSEFLSRRLSPVNVSVEAILQTYRPHEYHQRKQQQQQELQALYRCVGEGRHEVPIFVCMTTLPCVACPLHVFEPRYRLLVRRCMESGTRQFGMAAHDDHNPFADYGTMLEIKDVRYTPDGRSILNTVGGRRFKVLERGHCDGYDTAVVEYIHDVPIVPQDRTRVKSLHDTVHHQTVAWFSSQPENFRSRVRQHYGTLPTVEDDALCLGNGPSWHWWALNVLPLNERTKLDILKIDRLTERLNTLSRLILLTPACQQHR